MTERASAARWVAAVRTAINRLAGLSGLRNAAVMVLSGAFAALALPPVNALPALFAFALLLLTLDRRRTLRSAFVTGWSFAFGYHVAMRFWSMATGLPGLFRLPWQASRRFLGSLAVWLACSTGGSGRADGRGRRRWRGPGLLRRCCGAMSPRDFRGTCPPLSGLSRMPCCSHWP